MTTLFAKKIHKHLEYWVFVLPIFLPFIIFFIVPFFVGVFYSLFQWNGISPSMEFIGIQNYIDMFTRDEGYYVSLQFTIKYVALNVILTNVLAVAIALLLDMNIKARNFLRASFFLPNVISSIVTGFIWTFIFTQGSSSLFELTGWGLFKTNWLGDPNIAVFSMVLVSLWQGMGYIMVIYLAGLQSIDNSIIEASIIDGAYGFRKLFNVTLPLIMPSITVNLFMTLSQSFRLFDLNISLTNGGPGKSTLSLALDIYREAFSNNMTGYGAAKAVVLFIIVMVITVAQVKYTKSREVQY